MPLYLVTVRREYRVVAEATDASGAEAVAYQHLCGTSRKDAHVFSTMTNVLETELLKERLPEDEDNRCHPVG